MCMHAYVHAVSSLMYDSLQPCRLLISRLLCPWDSSGKKTGVCCHFLLQGIFLTLGSKLCLLRFLRCRQILTAELLGKPLSAYSRCKVMRQVWRSKAVGDKKADSCSLYITILTLYYSCNSCVSDSRCLVRLLSCPTLCDPMDCSLPWDFPGKNTGVGCHFLLQDIFPTQGLNPGLLHCGQTLYPLSHREVHVV